MVAWRGSKRAGESIVRLGIVGTGYFAGYHLGLLAETDPDTEVVAHLARSEAKAADAASRFGGKPYTSIADFIGDGKPDAVIVTVPPARHGEIEHALIEAGIPFLVEKPIGLDDAVPTSIVQAIARKGLVAAVGYNWRALDTLPAVRAQLEATPLRMVLGRFHGGTPGAPWWRFEAQSGGQMVEQACHVIDLARHIAGDGELLAAAGSFGPLPGFADGDVAGASAALFRLGGVPAVVTATAVLPSGPGPELRLICEGCEIAITLSGVDIIKGTERSRIETATNCYVNQNRAFFAAVRSGDAAAVTCTYDDALITHRLTLEVAAQVRRPSAW